MATRLNVGVVGAGRMGRIYAADLAQRIPNARLAAVADKQAAVAESFARDYGVPKWYASHLDLLDDPRVEAVAVISPTSTHREVVIAALNKGQPVFCEKPLSISIAEAEEMLAAVERTGTFFQMGFQRRFDAGYQAAKKKIDAGAIGTPVLIKSTSRDPLPPTREYCDPKSSGGLIIDMGIHDFDITRMFMGDVKSVHAMGGALAYPWMKEIGDIDNAVINMVFGSGALGCIQLSRHAIFGYDIRAEVWGTKGSVQVGYLRETPVLVMTEDGVTHDVVPNFMQRFEKAYLAQMSNFVENVLHGRPPAITCADGVAALRVSVAATVSARENRTVEVREISGASAQATVKN